MVRDCTRLGKGAPLQTSQPQRAPRSSQAMITALVATSPTHPARGGGRRGITLVCHRDASVLFNTGSTYSYVSYYFAPHLCVSRDTLSSLVYVSTRMGDSLIVDRIYRSCLVALSGFETRVDLLLLSMVDFDIALGMDWLSPHYAILDCHAKTVKLAMPVVPRVEWRSALDHTPSRVISLFEA
ncbi:uncharacterized protein [Nicotiana sylvestris]|uniref:uncharacterized protein n=1 Tax=Nicotiana sylvestris TaxID=4096 RepID=UPI00388CD4B7